MSVGFLSRVPVEGPRGPAPEIYAFGPFVLDPTRHTLTRDGRPVTLTPKTFELLPLRRRVDEDDKDGRTKESGAQALWAVGSGRVTHDYSRTLGSHPHAARGR